MHVAVLSLGKSLGSTSTAVGLAGAWADRGAEPVLVELDPSGGDGAGLWNVSTTTGTTSLIGQVSTSEDDDPLMALRRHSVKAPLGFDVVVSPVAATAALPRIVGDLGGKYGLALERPGVPVVTDCGRWNSFDAGADRVRSAYVVVALLTPDIGGVERARVLLDEVRGFCSTPHVVACVVGDRPYGADEVSATLRCPVRVIPSDGKVVRAVVSGQGTAAQVKRLKRSSWWRSLAGFTAEIDALRAQSLSPGFMPVAPGDQQ